MLCALQGEFVLATNHHLLAVPLLVGIFLYNGANLVDLLLQTDWTRKIDRILSSKRLIPIYSILFILVVIQKWQ